jgi:hypothetical protein
MPKPAQINRRKANTFTVEFVTLNSAFDEEPHFEIARILRDIADKITVGIFSSPISASNGNRVGKFECRDNNGLAFERF